MHAIGTALSYLYHHAAFVVTDGNVVGAPEGGDKPHPLQAVVQCGLQAVGGGMPDTHGAWRGGTILTCKHNENIMHIKFRE